VVTISRRARIVLATAAISVWAISILLEASRFYSILAVIAFSSVLIFTGSDSKEQLERQVPFKEQLWVWLFVALMVGNGIYSKLAGKPLVPELSADLLKLTAGLIWLVALIGAALVLFRGASRGEA